MRMTESGARVRLRKKTKRAIAPQNQRYHQKTTERKLGENVFCSPRYLRARIYLPIRTHALRCVRSLTQISTLLPRCHADIRRPSFPHHHLGSKTELRKKPSRAKKEEKLSGASFLDQRGLPAILRRAGGSLVCAQTLPMVVA